FIPLETVRQILRAQDPGIVWQTAPRISPGVRVHQLACRRHTDGEAVERETLRILNEVEQMRVTAAEFLGAVDPECVIPDDPAAAGKPQLVLKDELQLRCVFVADRQPKR